MARDPLAATIRQVCSFLNLPLTTNKDTLFLHAWISAYLASCLVLSQQACYYHDYIGTFNMNQVSGMIRRRIKRYEAGFIDIWTNQAAAYWFIFMHSAFLLS